MILFDLILTSGEDSWQGEFMLEFMLVAFVYSYEVLNNNTVFLTTIDTFIHLFINSSHRCPDRVLDTHIYQ